MRFPARVDAHQNTAYVKGALSQLDRGSSRLEERVCETDRPLAEWARLLDEVDPAAAAYDVPARMEATQRRACVADLTLAAVIARSEPAWPEQLLWLLWPLNVNHKYFAAEVGTTNFETSHVELRPQIFLLADEVSKKDIRGGVSLLGLS